MAEPEPGFEILPAFSPTTEAPEPANSPTASSGIEIAPTSPAVLEFPASDN
jgi:hypothetical protein